MFLITIMIIRNTVLCRNCRACGINFQKEKQNMLMWFSVSASHKGNTPFLLLSSVWMSHGRFIWKANRNKSANLPMYFHVFIYVGFLPATVMLPPDRLEVLIKQALQHQKENCIYHNSTLDNDLNAISILTDHKCTRFTTFLFLFLLLSWFYKTCKYINVNMLA